MGGTHGATSGYLDRDTVLHRAAAHRKIVGAVLFVLAVVATPRGVWWPYAVAAAVVLSVATLARVPPTYALRRLVIEIPFVLFAVLLAVISGGPRTVVLGLSLSESGLVTAGGLLAKATLGVIAAVVLAATTRPVDVVSGLQTLRLPAVMVEILSFMLRYLTIVVGDLNRMRIARESRGFTGSHAGHARAVAGSAGALFIRSYERGERLHLAMLSRGYTGSLPPDVVRRADRTRTPVLEWVACLAPAVVVASGLLVRWLG